MNITPFTGQQTASLASLIPSGIEDTTAVKVMFADVLTEQTLVSGNSQIEATEPILTDKVSAAESAPINPVQTSKNNYLKTKTLKTNSAPQSGSEPSESVKPDIISAAIPTKDNVENINNVATQVTIQSAFAKNNALLQNIPSDNSAHIQWAEEIHKEGNSVTPKAVKTDKKNNINTKETSQINNSTYNANRVLSSQITTSLYSEINDTSLPSTSMKRGEDNVIIQVNEKPNLNAGITTAITPQTEGVHLSAPLQNIHVENSQFRAQIIEQDSLPKEVIEALQKQLPANATNVNPLVVQGDSTTYYILSYPQKDENIEAVDRNLTLGESIGNTLNDIAKDVYSQVNKEKGNTNNTAEKDALIIQQLTTTPTKKLDAIPNAENIAGKNSKKSITLSEAKIDESSAGTSQAENLHEQPAKKIHTTSKSRAQVTAAKALAANANNKGIIEIISGVINNEESNTITIHDKDPEQNSPIDTILKSVDFHAPIFIGENKNTARKYPISENDKDVLHTSEEIVQPLQDTIVTEVNVQDAQQKTVSQFSAPIPTKNNKSETTVRHENRSEDDSHAHNVINKATTSDIKAPSTIPSMKKGVKGNTTIVADKKNGSIEDIPINRLPIANNEVTSGTEKTTSVDGLRSTNEIQPTDYSETPKLHNNATQIIDKANNKFDKANPTVSDTHEPITEELSVTTKNTLPSDKNIENATIKNHKENKRSVKTTATLNTAVNILEISDKKDVINSNKTTSIEQQSNIEQRLNKTTEAKNNAAMPAENYTPNTPSISDKIASITIEDNITSIGEKQSSIPHVATPQTYLNKNSDIENTTTNKYTKSDSQKPEITDKLAANHIQAVLKQSEIGQSNAKVLVVEYQHVANSVIETVSPKSTANAIEKYLGALPPEITSTIDKIVVSVKNANQVKNEPLSVSRYLNTIINGDNKIVKESEFSSVGNDTSAIADNNINSEKIVDSKTQTNVAPRTSSAFGKKLVQNNKRDILEQTYSGLSASVSAELPAKQPTSDIALPKQASLETKNDSRKNMQQYRNNDDIITEKEYTNDAATTINEPQKIQENTSVQLPLRRVNGKQSLKTDNLYLVVKPENNYNKRVVSENSSLPITQIMTGKANEVYGLPMEQRLDEINTELMGANKANEVYLKNNNEEINIQNEQTPLQGYLPENQEDSNEYKTDSPAKQNAALTTVGTLSNTEPIVIDAENSQAVGTGKIGGENNKGNQETTINKQTVVTSDTTISKGISSVINNEYPIEAINQSAQPSISPLNDEVIHLKEYQLANDVQEPDNGKRELTIPSVPAPEYIQNDTTNVILSRVIPHSQQNTITANNDNNITHSVINNNKGDNTYYSTDNTQHSSILAPEEEAAIQYLNTPETAVEKLNIRDANINSYSNGIASVTAGKDSDKDVDSIAIKQQSIQVNTQLISTDITTKNVQQIVPKQNITTDVSPQNTVGIATQILEPNVKGNETVRDVVLQSIISNDSVERGEDSFHSQYSSPLLDSQSVIDVIDNARRAHDSRIDTLAVRQPLKNTSDKASDIRENAIVGEYSNQSTFHRSGDNNIRMDNTYHPNMEPVLSPNTVIKAVAGTNNKIIDEVIHEPSISGNQQSIQPRIIATSESIIHETYKANIEQDIPDDKGALHTANIEQNVPIVRKTESENSTVMTPVEIPPMKTMGENNSVIAMPQKKVPQPSDDMKIAVHNAAENEQNDLYRTVENYAAKENSIADSHASLMVNAALEQTVGSSLNTEIRHENDSKVNLPIEHRNSTTKNNELSPSALKVQQIQQELNSSVAVKTNGLQSNIPQKNEILTDKAIADSHIMPSLAISDSIMPSEENNKKNTRRNISDNKIDSILTIGRNIDDNVRATNKKQTATPEISMPSIGVAQDTTISSISENVQSEAVLPNTISPDEIIIKQDTNVRHIKGEKRAIPNIDNQTLPYQASDAEDQTSELNNIRQDEDIVEYNNNRPQYSGAKNNVENGAQYVQNTVASSPATQKPLFAAVKHSDTSATLTSVPPLSFDSTNAGQFDVVDKATVREDITDNKMNTRVNEPINESNKQRKVQNIQNQQTSEYKTIGNTTEEQNTLEFISQPAIQHKIIHGAGENLRKNSQTADDKQIHSRVPDSSAVADGISPLASNLQSSEQESQQQGNDNSADKRAEAFSTPVLAQLKENTFTAALHTEKQKKNTSENQSILPAAQEKNVPLQEQTVFFTPFGSPVMRGMKKNTSVREYRNVDIAKTSEYIMRLAESTTSGSRSAAVLHLRPESLGGVTLSVAVQGNSVGVSIGVETTEAQQTIAAQVSSLRDQLTKNGMAVTTIEVLPQQQDATRQQGSENFQQSGGSNSREEHGQRQAYLRSLRPAVERREVNTLSERAPVNRKITVNGSIEHYI